jgi:hypothetical protein
VLPGGVTLRPGNRIHTIFWLNGNGKLLAKREQKTWRSSLFIDLPSNSIVSLAMLHHPVLPCRLVNYPHRRIAGFNESRAAAAESQAEKVRTPAHSSTISASSSGRSLGFV